MDSACFALHLRVQNAGIIIHRREEDSIIIESFEASPAAKQVNDTLGRLKREFPGIRVAMSWTRFSNPDFLCEFSQWLRRLNSEQPSRESKEALEVTTASWDSQHPFMISEFLMVMLAADGKREKPTLLKKRTRDHALCEDVDKPENVWRRSPLWLVLRVAMQIAVQRAFPNDKTFAQYKSYIQYLIAALGSEAMKAGFAADVLKAINEKLARRMYKMGKKKWKLEEFVASRTVTEVERLRGHLDGIWLDEHKCGSRADSSLQGERKMENAMMPSLQNTRVTDADCALPLNNSLPLLQDRINRKSQNQELTPFEPDMGGEAIKPTKFPSLPLTGSWQTKLLNLADYEAWIINHLEKWAMEAMHTPKECGQLWTHMQNHFHCAKELYDPCPREMSATLLLVLEMWMALDRACVKKYPVVAEYRPPIPEDFLQPLLLPKKQQLQRLQNFEIYLKSRYEGAILQSAGLLEDSGEKSFATRYYDASSTLKDFRRVLEKEAQQKYEKKEQEWKEKLQQKEDIERAAAELQCEYECIPGSDPVHLQEFRRCVKAHEAKDLKISQMRHPLPEDEQQLKKVIFELKCPKFLLVWRDATWWIIQELGRFSNVASPTQSRQMKLPLEKNKPLMTMPCTKHQLDPRTVSLASCKLESTKTIPLPEEFRYVYLRSGLQFYLFDSKHQCWVGDQEDTPSIKHMCTLELPHGKYKKLDWALKTNQHTPNEAMANQNERDPKVPFNEYISFCELRAGERTQWPNIFVELAGCHLSFEEEATALLVFQTIWEAGRPDPGGDATREAHRHLIDEDFCLKLLGLLEQTVDAVRGSWKRQTTIMVVIVLLQRVLSVTTSPNVAKATMELLNEIRQVALNWCHVLKSQTEMSMDGDDRCETELRLHRAALLCCFSYDVEDAYIENILTTDESVAILMEACILAQASKPQASILPPDIHRLRLWNLHSLHHLQPQLQRLVNRSALGLNTALRSFLGDVSLDSRWTILGQAGVKGRKGRWAKSKIFQKKKKRAKQTIHYDFLFGELFVDGVQVGKVPDEIASRPFFQHVFGKVCINLIYSNDLIAN